MSRAQKGRNNMHRLDPGRLVLSLECAKEHIEPETGEGVRYILDLASHLEKGPVPIGNVDFGRFAETDLREFRRMYIEEKGNSAAIARAFIKNVEKAAPSFAKADFI